MWAVSGYLVSYSASYVLSSESSALTSSSFAAGYSFGPSYAAIPKPFVLIGYSTESSDLVWIWAQTTTISSGFPTFGYTFPASYAPFANGDK